MVKQRTKTPKDTRESVLLEFNHRCAICGKDRPQIHHIDEDPSNNAESNLLPLCPNHHLSDQHDPTRMIDPVLLALFRKHKDPQMLSSRFEPIFRRLKLLIQPAPNSTFAELSGHAVDLASFTSRLTLGDYYFGQLQRLLDWSVPNSAEIMYGDPSQKYKERLEANLPAVIQLLVEQLRYQDWPPFLA